MKIRRLPVLPEEVQVNYGSSRFWRPNVHPKVRNTHQSFHHCLQWLQLQSLSLEPCVTIVPLNRLDIIKAVCTIVICHVYRHNMSASAALRYTSHLFVLRL